ncbi:MAG: hypothetical protein ABL952_15765 [Pyrinomonadaceae bacterium]
MKQCPACRTTYTDETLSYCLADGTPLEAVLDEQPTVVRPFGAGTVRVDIPQQQKQPVFVPTPAQQTSGGGLRFVVAGLVGLILLLVVGGVVGAIFYLNRNSEIAGNNNNTRPATSPAASPTTDDQNKLKDQIANLERRLNEQKNANRPAANVPPPTTTTGSAARVNSPGDGFLALRSSPSSQSGQRILKIPHGATIVLGECLSSSGKGRWCRTSYGGYSGWVFDAFLVY